MGPGTGTMITPVEGNTLSRLFETQYCVHTNVPAGTIPTPAHTPDPCFNEEFLRKTPSFTRPSQKRRTEVVQPQGTFCLTLPTRMGIFYPRYPATSAADGKKSEIRIAVSGTGQFHDPLLELLGPAVDVAAGAVELFESFEGEKGLALGGGGGGVGLFPEGVQGEEFAGGVVSA